jgi:hypothetical protein
MSAMVKSKSVNSWAGLWFRIDEKGTTESLGFDNMEKRPIKGTTEWKEYQIVLDVPSNAYRLAYGILMDGEGEVWISDLKFEIVDNTVPVTAGKENDDDLPEPSNLDFSKAEK